MALSGPAEGMGRLIFYRPPEALLVAVEPRILVNGKSVGPIAMDTAFYRDALPGFYKVHLEHEEEDAVILQVLPGKTLFLRTRLVWEMLGYELRVERIEPGTGSVEAAVLRWHAPKNANAPLTFMSDDAPIPAD
jgi:hypothetical protein